MEVDDIKNLSFEKKVLFSYLTCQRMIPNYMFFSKKYDFGNYSVLEKCLSHALSIIMDDKQDLSSLQLEDLVNQIHQVTPLPQNYDTVLASSAMDACGCAFELVNYIVDKKENRVITISTLAFDTVDMYIQETENLDYNDPYFEKKISDNALMQKERKVQKGIIDYLKKIDSVQMEDIVTLEKLQNNNIGNLNLA